MVSGQLSELFNALAGLGTLSGLGLELELDDGSSVRVQVHEPDVVATDNACAAVRTPKR